MNRSKTSPFGIVSKSILCDPELSPEAKAIYSVLCCFADKAGRCFPSVSLLCNVLNMEERRFRRHLKQLIDSGVIVKQREREGNLKRGNVYLISDNARRPDPAILEGYSSDPAILEASGPDPAFPRSCNSRPVQNDSTNNTIVRTRPDNYNNTTVTQLCVFVCDCLNSRKAALYCRGRLKPCAYAENMLKGLLDAGFTDQEIREHAQYLSERGKEAELYWFSFEDSISHRKRKPAREYHHWK